MQGAGQPGECATRGGIFCPTSGPYLAAYRGKHSFADHGSRCIGGLDPANGNAGDAFATLAGSPVDLLTGVDGALYVLTRGRIARISAP